MLLESLQSMPKEADKVPVSVVIEEVFQIGQLELINEHGYEGVIEDFRLKNIDKIELFRDYPEALEAIKEGTSNVEAFILVDEPREVLEGDGMDCCGVTYRIRLLGNINNYKYGHWKLRTL